MLISKSVSQDSSRHRVRKLFCRVMLTLFSMNLLLDSAIANVDHDLNQFFRGLGYESNVTSPTAFHDQAAGYYSGGSIFLRNQVKNYQIMSIELPSFSAGCAGIDLFLGSFSVISADEAIQMIKNILSSAGMYAFDLALTTVLPQIKSVKDKIQQYVDQINQFNINSCDTAEDLVGGAWPKMQATQQQICRDIGSHNGVFNDWAQSRQGCGAGGKFDKGMKNAGDREAEIIVNKNLVWAALQHNPMMRQDQELAEMLMSLSGSIIVRVDNTQQQEVSPGVFTPKTQKVPLPPVAADRNVIKALLYGGEMKIYTCDEIQHCLNPVKKSITITKQHSLVYQVADMIGDLEWRVARDEGQLSPALRGLLEMSPLPILKHIVNSLSLGKAVNGNQLGDLIGISLLNQYLAENLRIVREALSQQDNSMKQSILEQLNKTQRLVAEALADSHQQLINVDVLVNTMRADEQQLTARLVNQALAKGAG